MTAYVVFLIVLWLGICLVLGGAVVVLLALYGGGTALCVYCRRVTGLKGRSDDSKVGTSRRVSRLVVWLGLLVFLLVVGFFGVAVLGPGPAGRPDVVVGVVGFTNGVSGERLAVFGVTNRSGRMVFAYLPTVQVKSASSPSGFTNYFQGGTNQWRRLHSKIGRGESVQFTILAPPLTNGSAWRVMLNVYADFDVAQRMRRFLLLRRRRPFQIESEWIEEIEN